MDKDIAKISAKILLDTKSVLVNTKKPFTYTSGKTGPVYVDCRRLISFPKERSLLMDYGAQILKDLDLDYIAGGETAGIPYAAFISERLELPMLYVRKKPKGFGRMAQIEGAMEQDNSSVALVEDMQTDGGSKLSFIQALREAGATIDHTFVIFHYGIFPESDQNMAKYNVTLHNLCDWWDIIKVAQELKYFDHETLSSLENFLNAPHEWAA
jgi:orotate phosphoribosyltransferase